MPALGHIYGEGWKGNGELCSPTIINLLNEHNQPRQGQSQNCNNKLIMTGENINYLSYVAMYMEIKAVLLNFAPIVTIEKY